MVLPGKFPYLLKRVLTLACTHNSKPTNQGGGGGGKGGKYFLILDAGNRNSKQPHKKPEEIRKP